MPRAADHLVHGEVSEGFGPVADAFLANVESRGDTGAACAVYHGGSLVVDLWAGTTDAAPWTPDVRSCVFSVSKGVTSVLVLMAVERGLVDLDGPVSEHWPEYAARGKDRTTVRDLLAHRAGVMSPRTDLTVADLRDWTPVVDALSAQSPSWEPGTAYAYHALTFGWLAGEVLRRASGHRPSGWLRTEVAEPLGLDMTFGTAREDPSFCPMLEPLPTTDLAYAARMASFFEDPLVIRSLSLGGAIDPADLFGSFNKPEILGCEIPGGGLVTNARSLARLYAATVGEVDGVRLLGPATVGDAREVRSEGKPFVGPDEGHRWGTGFMLSSVRRGMLGEGSFGHDGAGGHLAFGHLEAEVGFGYQTSRPGGFPDERAEALCAALRSCLP
jgi:CubicO group peptidase (beta-lactamase class C family)